MKKFTILFAFLICFNSMLFSQDWQPVKRNMQSYFADAYSVVDSIIVNSIYVDSVEVDGQSGDSVFYLNRLTLNCDTCGNAVKITNQPHFLNSKMIKHSEQVFEFLDPGQIVLYVNKPVGYTWIYDSINELTAEISYKNQLNLFGTNDSVMSIFLQNWGSIEISKNHGITYYGKDLPDIFFLVGMDHPQMGKEVINYDDIFNFHPGDIFQYMNIDYGYDPSTGTHSFHSIQKEKILSKTIKNNSIEYFVKTLVMNWEENFLGIPSDTTFSQSYDTVIYSSEPWLNYNCIPGSAASVNEIAFGDEAIYSIALDTNNDDGDRIKMFGPGLNQTGTNFYLYDEESNYLYNYSLSGYFNYTVNLGSEYYIWMVELGKERYLQGYVRNGDTTGYIMPDDDFLVSLEENKTSTENIFSIYPNPAKDHFYIKLNDKNIQEAEIRVMNLKSNLLKYIKLLSSDFPYFINMEDLPEGVFIIRLQTPKVIRCKKLLIQR